MSNGGPAMQRTDFGTTVDPRVSGYAAKKGTLCRFVPTSGDPTLLIKMDDGFSTNWQVIGADLSAITPVRVATTANINLSSAPASIDDVVLAEGDLVLVKDQTAPSENGVYDYNGSGNAMTRNENWNEADEFYPGREIFVEEGDANSTTLWINKLVVNTLGTDPVVFIDITQAAEPPYVYIVGPGQNYTTIQEAINAAQADGVNAAQRGVIKILPGTYTEDLTFIGNIILQGYVGLNGSGFVTIEGQHTYTPTAGGDITTHQLVFNNIQFIDTVVGNTFEMIGANGALVIFQGCNFIKNSANGSAIVNDASATSSLVFAQGSLYGTTTDALVAVSLGTLQLNQFSMPTGSSRLFNISGTAAANILDGSMTSNSENFGVISSTTPCFITRCLFSSAFSPDGNGIQVLVGATLYCTQCTFNISAGSGFIFYGNGTVNGTLLAFAIQDAIDGGITFNQLTSIPAGGAGVPSDAVNGGTLDSSGAQAMVQGLADGAAAELNATGDQSFASGRALEGVISAVGIGSRAKGLTTDAGDTVNANGDASEASGATDTASNINASGRGASARGAASGASAITASGSGTTAIGFAESGSDIIANADGSIAMGHAVNTGHLLASGSGALAVGNVGNSNATITASGDGSVAMGHCNTGQIIASGLGSFAHGAVDDNTGQINATAAGAFAHGSSESSGRINATGKGSVAMGAALAPGRDITATGIGSIAVGTSDGAVDLTAGARSSQAFGEDHTVTGVMASAFGLGHANGVYACFAVGRYASIAGTAGAWVATELAFVVGIGTGTGSPANAFSVGKDANIKSLRTVTPGGTTGDQTIDAPQGSVNFAAAATTLKVTNNLVTANSTVLAMIQTNDATARILNVQVSAGEFDINMEVAPTAETRVAFFVFN